MPHQGIVGNKRYYVSSIENGSGTVRNTGVRDYLYYSFQSGVRTLYTGWEAPEII